jgi:putative glycosyl hydrolase-like family 6 (GHL6) protein/glycosyl hydrolase family 42 (putative beta-galactosidase)
MHDPKWCLFFDFHTMPACPDVGAAFDANATADWFQECGVDYVVFPARCNLGMAYYDTQIGIRHPSMETDLLGELTRACHARDIALTAYLNTGLSHEEGLRHRDWLVLPESGETYRPNRLDHFFRQMCYNTPYGEHVTEMACEVVAQCGVDGLFLDCMHTAPCVGQECLRKMADEGIDWQDADQINAFNERKVIELGRRISAAARKINPDLMIYCNGIGYEAQADFGSYLEFECLPTGGWGYELLPVGARYLRTLGKPVLNMTGRFHRSWGDFGGIRTPASIEYDCLYGLANGLRPTIGDHFHPRGELNRAVMQLDRDLYGRLRQLDPWLQGATPLTDAAVLMLKPYPGYAQRAPQQSTAYRQEFDAVKAATRMLCELDTQFDVVSLGSSWDGYRLLVLPDYVRLDGEVCARIRAHLDGGGAVLSTAWSGLDPATHDFVLEDWGLTYQGEDPYDPAYLSPSAAFADGLPDMPLTLYERGTCVSAHADTEVLATITAPYYNRHWDGEHGFVYLPPDRPTDRPAVTLHDRVAHVSHPIFTSYWNSAPLPMRQIVAGLLQRLLPLPLLRAPDAPSFARLTVTAQPGRRMIHVLAYLPERRGAATDMIEEPLILTDQVVELRLDGRTPRRVYLAPQEQEIPFEVVDQYVRVRLDRVEGYALVVIEE